MSDHILVEFDVDLRLRDSENAGPTRSERKMADEIERLRAKIQRLENECYKKCGVCEFDYGRAAPKETQ